MSTLRRPGDGALRSVATVLAASSIWVAGCATSPLEEPARPGGGWGSVPTLEGQDAPAKVEPSSPLPAGQGSTDATSASAGDAAEPPPAQAANAEAYPLHGYASLGWRGRWTEGANDSDLFGFVTMDGGDPTRNDVTFNVTARASWDTGGGNAPDSPFFNITDTYSNAFDPRLYLAHFDVHSVEALPVLRVGRQMDVETPEPAYYDGVHLQSADLADGKFHIGGYGGLSTHLYESTDAEDNVFGAYLGSQPWEDGRLRLDWMRASDHRRSDGEGEDLYSLAIWQNLMETVSVDGFVSVFRDAGRDLRLGGSWYEPESDVLVKARYYQLLTEQTTSALEFDPFTASLFDEAPFHQVSLSASKGFGPRYRLTGGFDLRRLSESEDAGQFNRDFDRGYLTVTFAELFEETTSISVTGDLWDSGEKRYATAGIDMTSELGERLDASIGTFFSMYKTRVLTLEEYEDVRTYFARIAYDLTADLQLDLRFDFEDTSIGDFQVLRTDLKWCF